MKHYICTGGCQGVSDVPGTCQAKDCVKHGQPLNECECTDDLHQKPDQSENQEKEQDTDKLS
ncbi:hypothetical protein A3C23_03290 [Candidatus Roizmanbacteria bacterium RIFCSPHIGHO2_02_FULL_37_13b]|uniref:Uncharacterized protein n=1 Tax=Candidatus Roizmanbacteria bacterium RIFCSPLOWO2_02_FULL_36_11 TaxID=1802071 RepID=A0A1F7JGH9_9BACT|nr:MAG: hypothetical protein A3C23_03290 [Candidatus Roizmanbacteria bacterium RIFCSPHIGHO2_02_FULL_37_13b]OGK54717.1 MAG: hypothetical protein A3H78_05490 [Candidatus Roizmanbacteria bacterium RIFCSPLOWO2_02_FULL_36_11]